MKDERQIYIAIDLKSFYASVECVDRGLDPLGVNLVVADVSRTDKGICLAVSPAMKSYGLGGRCRLYEANQKIREVNAERRRVNKGRPFKGKSYVDKELKEDPALALDCIVAVPRMARYLEISTEIFKVYLDFVSADDIHVYSIDEVFINATPYLAMYGISAHELTLRMVRAVLAKTGITATAGIGTNLYLAKVAMDIVAKKMPADKDGVRIAELDEMSYRERLWEHEPLSDFWRIGSGIERRLHKYGIKTMGDIARISIADDRHYLNMERLYKEFGKNAEFLIDHAWGIESCTMKAIKEYKPKSHSLSSCQVLHSAYRFEKARIVAREMAENLSFELLQKGLFTKGLSLFVVYDRENVIDDLSWVSKSGYYIDRKGNVLPKPAHSGVCFREPTFNVKELADAAVYIFDRIACPSFTVRNIGLCCTDVVSIEKWRNEEHYVQGDLFETDEERNVRIEAKQKKEKEENLQIAVMGVKNRYGKNAVMKAFDLQEGATQIERNMQIGGHKA